MIIAKNISYKDIISELNISANNGEITTILGQNGTGKSTLLKIISSSLKPDSGKVLVADKNINNYSDIELAKIRSVMLQFNNINFPFTAYEIALMGRVNYINEKENKNIINYLMEEINATHLKDRLFTTLSGGEKQIITFIRAIAQIWDVKNSYLFLDEPSSALDLKYQNIIFNFIKKITKYQNICTIIINHDINLTREFSNKIIMLKNKKLFKSGATQKTLTEKNINQLFDI